MHPKYDRLITDLIFDKTTEREIRVDQSIRSELIKDRKASQVTGKHQTEWQGKFDFGAIQLMNSQRKKELKQNRPASEKQRSISR